jgi:hypothetical protein
LAQRGSTPRFYANETQYPNREVSSILRWVMKYLEVENDRCFVKIKYHSGGHAYQGRFYPNVHSQVGHVYREAYVGAGYGEYHRVAPVVPRGFSHLIVCRIGKPGTYPCMNHVYDRKDSPGAWEIADWQEALVAIAAHEAMHLRQYKKNPRGKRGRFNEVETEWAAYRLWKEWVETKKKA